MKDQQGRSPCVSVAHLAEASGMDAEIHVCGPAHRACMSAVRNSNYYKVGLVGPDCVNADGCVSVSTGPGLGVTYDWDFIVKNRIALHEFS